MRGAIRRRQGEDEEESAFVSMTDLTVSFLFIVIILLAFFASQLKDEEVVPLSEHVRVVAERDRLQLDMQSLAADIERLRARIAMLDADLAEARSELAARTAELARRIIERDEARARILVLERDVAERDRIVAELRQRVDALEAKLAQAPDPIEAYLTKVADRRLRILETLQSGLRADFPDLQVIINAEMDALRFKGDGLFQSGSSELAADKRRIVEAIALRIGELLPCYTLGRLSRWSRGCNEAGAVIEAVQIEGHTDASGSDRFNLDLSAKRATETFFAMTGRVQTLIEHLNPQGQPVLSVSGYGKTRPVAENTTEAGKATNRRINLRIIMYTPRAVADIDRIKAELRQGMTGTRLQ